MAASPSTKPGAVHFWLIGFVMMTLILLVTTIMFAKNHREALAVTDQTKKDQSATQAALTNTLADVESLKAMLGLNQADVGTGNSPDPNSVLGAGQRELTTFGIDLAQPTYSATLGSMRTRLDALNEENKQLKASLQSEKDAFLASLTGANNRVETHKNDKEKSEGDLTNLVKERDELVRQKDAEIAKWQQTYRTEQVEKEQIRDELNRISTQFNEQVSRLNQIVDFQRQQLDELQNISFDTPDANISNVDNTTHTVWLNVGRKDGLRPQVTFSIYGRSNQGIARGPEDVKAKVEIVEVHDTSAVARIVEEDRDRPVSIGDVAFSPAWSAGMKDFFAIVGDGDLNGDGEMDAKDRKMLKDLLGNAGADVDVEITSEGQRIPEEATLSVHTKWLVVGDVGDPSKFTSDNPKRSQILEVQKQQKELVQEAREHGIKIVSLKDFLTYLGWKPESRLYIPGSQGKFNLKAGARNPGFNTSVGSEEPSTGTTSSKSGKNALKPVKLK